MLYIKSGNWICLTRGDTARITVDIIDSFEEQHEIKDDDILILSVKETTRSDNYCLQKKIIGSNMFYIKPEDTEHMNFQKYKYDVQLVTNNDVYTVIEPSTFEILPEVTTTWQ